MNIRIGIWAGGDSANDEGTIEWAGGATQYADGPFTMVLEKIEVVNENPGGSYSYGDLTGGFESIVVHDGDDKNSSTSGLLSSSSGSTGSGLLNASSTVEGGTASSASSVTRLGATASASASASAGAVQVTTGSALRLGVDGLLVGVLGAVVFLAGGW